MKTRLKTTGLISALTLVIACVLGIGSASATSTSLYITNLYNGESVPAGYVPGGPNNSWLEATLTSTDSGSSWANTLYLQAFLPTSPTSMFVGGSNGGIGWAFNFSSVSSLLSGVTCSGICPAYGYTYPSLPQSVPQGFNFAVYWTAQGQFGRFEGNDTTTINWSSSSQVSFSGLDPADYNDLWSLVHIQGYGNGCSGWFTNMAAGTINGGVGSITSCASTPVPEPSELPMMAFGVALMFGGWIWSKRRQVRASS